MGYKSQSPEGVLWLAFVLVVGELTIRSKLVTIYTEVCRGWGRYF